MNFACPMKISQGVLIFFFFLVFPLPRIFKDPTPLQLIIKKPKLNQTKIKLKREIKIKTSNNIGKLSNKK